MHFNSLQRFSRAAAATVFAITALAGCREAETVPAPVVYETSTRTVFLECGSGAVIPSTWRNVEPDPTKADYVVRCALNLPALNIEPGVRVQFEGAEAGLSVYQLRSTGTADQPVILEGKQHRPGAWRGVEVRGPVTYPLAPPGTVPSQLVYTELREAGSQPHGPAALSQTGLLLHEDALLDLQHVRVSNCLGQGIVVLPGYAGALTRCANVTVTDCQGYPLVVNTASISAVEANCVLRGNRVDAVVYREGRWHFSTQPVTTFHPLRFLMLTGYLPSAAQRQTIIEPGAELKFAPGTRFATWLDQLTAVGTPAQPILFRGQTTGAGSWIGVHVTGTEANRMDYCIVQDAGQTDSLSGNSRGGVLLNPEPASSSTGPVLTITNSVLRDNQGWGIHAQQNGRLTQSSNTFLNNSAGTVGRFN